MTFKLSDTYDLGTFDIDEELDECLAPGLTDVTVKGDGFYDYQEVAVDSDEALEALNGEDWTQGHPGTLYIDATNAEDIEVTDFCTFKGYVTFFGAYSEVETSNYHTSYFEAGKVTEEIEVDCVWLLRDYVRNVGREGLKPDALAFYDAL